MLNGFGDALIASFNIAFFFHLVMPREPWLFPRESCYESIKTEHINSTEHIKGFSFFSCFLAV